MRFVKMHGVGNDYVFLDAYTEPALESRLDLSALARRVSDRHSGVGSDGLIVIAQPDAREPGADLRMRMFNADGSEAEMCGNGLRCVAKYAHDRLGFRDGSVRVATGAGLLEVLVHADAGVAVAATVNMGRPVLEPGRVPLELEHLQRGPRAHEWVLKNAETAGVLGARPFVGVSMGNPHAVFFTGDGGGGSDDQAGGDLVELARVGPSLESHAAFPRRANIHLVRCPARDRARMITWERGAGLTRACGTGACAAVVAGVLTGRLERRCTVELPGGALQVHWDARDGSVHMRGPAEEICTGDWPEPGVSARVLEAVTLVTERLVLRPFSMRDAPRVAELCADRAIHEGVPLIPHPYTLADARAWLARHDAQRRSGQELTLAITLGDAESAARALPAGTLVGSISLRPDGSWLVGEAGYWVGVAHWRRGYATEALRAMVRHGLETLGLRRVWACHVESNAASGRVMLKAGMRCVGRVARGVVCGGDLREAVAYEITAEGSATRR
jgi:diaminopimelate epimerase